MKRNLAIPGADLRATRVGDWIFISWRDDDAPPVTPAEAETLAYVLQGKSNREVANARGVSERTVANQIASAFRKLGVQSRFELTHRVRTLTR